MKSKPAYSDSKLETYISVVLITGVIISLLLELAGLTFYYLQLGSLSISDNSAVFLRGNDFFSFIYHALAETSDNDIAIKLMTSGLIVLILTPFVRVLASVIFFGWVKNLKYVWITLFVLAVITVSLSLH